MKRLIILFLVVGSLVENGESQNEGECQFIQPLQPRPHTVSVLEFGAVGDGETVNTVAFQNAIFYLNSFADKGGAQLYVPAGKWLTGTIDLISHLTLFLEKDAVILGSQDYNHWDIIDPLPSYGCGIEHQGARYRSLITGNNLNDVVITGKDITPLFGEILDHFILFLRLLAPISSLSKSVGNNGTIDGQGSVWWELFNSHSLNYSRPHLVEFIGSTDVVVSNLTFINAPSWNIRPVYCSNVIVQNITVHAPSESPYASGVVPDSSEHVCIENSNISTSYDAIALKSGWDEYGIAYDKPVTNVHIRGVHLQSIIGSGIAFGSEMSGGISNVLVEDFQVLDSFIGVELKTSRGRGGYIKDIVISKASMENVQQAIKATGLIGTHPDDKYDLSALPSVSDITFKDIVGTGITTVGNFTGISESPFTCIRLSNILFSITFDDSYTSWLCSGVSGSSSNVSPQPCPELRNMLSVCSLAHQTSLVAVL